MSWRALALGKSFLRETVRRTSKLMLADALPPAPRPFYGQDTMAVEGASDVHGIDRNELRRGLVTSSTKRRTAELSGLQHQVEGGGECESVPQRP